MTNEQLYNIIEYLLDNLEYYADKNSDTFTLKYTLELRQKLFDEKSNLSFEIKQN